ncbi:MAG TPA: hypothetical protein VGB62_10335 [Allosphingosinicella sp.]|jgi:uncharacterized repeat protein (TIGR01451 family)
MIFPARSARFGASRSKAAWLATALVSTGVLAGTANAAGTLAGTNITNVATATYDLPNGDPATIDSNTVTLLVDELLDVTVDWKDPADVATAPGRTAQLLTYTLANGGNGTEAFKLSTVANGGGDDFDPAVTSIVLDSNGNGAYDAGVDTVYVAGSNDPELAPDARITVFVLSSIPAGAADTNRAHADLVAVAKTGSGAPGTSFAGLGQGGGNAVVGATGADADAAGWYKVSKADLSFVKSATVADSFGGTANAPGATITYTLTATVNGSGSLANVKVADAIPAGTTFKPGSITLDSAPLSDAADSDAGAFTGSGISVGLGTLPSGSAKTITFQVKID